MNKKPPTLSYARRAALRERLIELGADDGMTSAQLASALGMSVRGVIKAKGRAREQKRLGGEGGGP